MTAKRWTMAKLQERLRDLHKTACEFHGRAATPYDKGYCHGMMQAADVLLWEFFGEDLYAAWTAEEVGHDGSGDEA
jgi:hypothetical protein